MRNTVRSKLQTANVHQNTREFNLHFNQQLLAAPTSAAALRIAYEFKKARFRGFSLTALGQRVGSNSKGYMADVLSGRRIISKQREEPLLEALELEGPVRSYIKQLAARDRRRIKGEEEVDESLAAGLALARAHIAAESGDQVPSSFKAFEVFCTSFLFKEGMKESDLLAYFGANEAGDLIAALDYLVKHKLFKLENEVYRAQTPHFIVGKAKPEDLENFITLALRDSLRRLPHWLGHNDVAHFESTVISVNKGDYIKILPRIREQLLAIQTTIDSEMPDEIVRFNIQIYPMGKKK